MWHGRGIKLFNTIILPIEFIRNWCLWKICSVLGSWCILWFLHQNVVLVTLFCIPYFAYGRSTELSECMSKCSWCGIQIFRLMVGLKMLFLHLCLRQETLWSSGYVSWSPYCQNLYFSTGVQFSFHYCGSMVQWYLPMLIWWSMGKDFLTWVALAMESKPDDCFSLYFTTLK